MSTPGGAAWLAPIPKAAGYWLEIEGDPAGVEARAQAMLPILQALLVGEREAGQLTEELANRYEEIDLLYAISEILGQTIRLDEAARTIVREVSTVVGARRASIMVYDESTGRLRTVAARGFSPDGGADVAVDDECSVAARVFRERRIISHDGNREDGVAGSCPDGRNYRGRAFLSVPICYAAPGAPARCVGVINLTDRLGGDAFTAGDRKLVAAIANQIGAAIENARLVARDLRQQRLRRELELAHDLQLKLLPRPGVLRGLADVAARFRPAETVGGDFYTFTRLAGGCVGVMLGDVSSHGFAAALVMALVMSAAGIHAAAAGDHPEEALRALLQSVGEELEKTEMYFSVFYGVLDPAARRLSYANAGHPHAFRVPLEGEPELLVPTAPPLGLAGIDGLERREVSWEPGRDLLCLWTDGLVDARSAQGESFGQARLLDTIRAHRGEPAERIVEAVLAEADAFSPRPADDRTLVVLRV
ncbi:MAG TPA: SpoIIE family protein phosphatase [Gemmatimonadales bacterium]|nr:SpoIIE family protein phosphatase [Gemmatimonadales bacterium]